MKALTVLVDMDDVLENLCDTWLSVLNERHGTSVGVEDIQEWDITKFFPSLTRKEVFRPLEEKDTWIRVKPCQGACEYTKKMIEDGHRVIVVTASNPGSKAVSYKFKYVLFKYFPHFSYKDVVIATQKQLIKGDVLIDDNPANLENADYFGILVNRPHNRNYKIQSGRMKRADTWDEIYRLICKLAQD